MGRDRFSAREAGNGLSNNLSSHNRTPLAPEALEPRTLFTSPPPTVLDAFVGGSHWRQPFKDYLAANVTDASAEHGLDPERGFGALGYLPWVNLDRITLKVNARLVVDQGDLSVRGVNVGQYPIVGFEYSFDPRAYRATMTWTLGRPLGNDRVLVRLDVDSPTGVRTGDFGDQLIDGDGDYRIGGDYVLRMNVLPGDVSGDGVVTATEFLSARSARLTSVSNAGVPPYSYYLADDVDGSGQINVIDMAHIRQRAHDRLPSPQVPASAPVALGADTSPFATARTRIRPVVRGLLAAT